MARNEDDKQVNIRMTEEEKNALMQFCKANGMSLNQAMARARELLLVDGLKSKAPEQGANIEDFEMHLNSILTAYRTSVEHSVNARALAEQEVKEEIKGMAELVSRNTQLSEEIKEKTNEIATLKEQVKDLTGEVEKLQNNCKNAESLQNENLQLKQQIIDMQAEHNKQIADLQADGFNKIIQVIQANQSVTTDKADDTNK